MSDENSSLIKALESIKKNYPHGIKKELLETSNNFVLRIIVLEEIDQEFLSKIVTKGLNLNLKHVEIEHSLSEANQIPTLVFGNSVKLVNNSDCIYYTYPLSEIANNEEKKRELWNLLKEIKKIL